jgi:hypothetical protein
LPPRDINGIKVLCHLRDHDRVKTAVCVTDVVILDNVSRSLEETRGRMYLETTFHDVPELLRLVVRWVCNLQVSSLGDDLLSGEVSLCVSPS